MNTTIATVFTEDDFQAFEDAMKRPITIEREDLQMLRRAIMHNLKRSNELLTVVNKILGMENNDE